MARTVLEVGPGALSEYYDWFKDAANGDVLVYWQGDLQFDRQVAVPDSDVLRAAERTRIRALNFVADRVLADAKLRHLHLTQARVGTNIFEYRATRRRDFDAKPTVSDIRNDNLVSA
ncbi:hypothetical protein [Bradyrhizobium sp. th.b2]|uniref:hypothetical protein n=1 Tax=Bradyrhizobium sp. th-b2 TaxID=172088 RepID=UPI00040F37E9|nr:hypothetical protein [Bradyrhizobium sp. th.b2]